MMTVNMMEGRMMEGCYHGIPRMSSQTWSSYQTVCFMAGMLGVSSQLQHYTGLMKPAVNGTQCQLQKDLSAITLSQSGVTTPCENVEESCLPSVTHPGSSQTSGWLQAVPLQKMQTSLSLQFLNLDRHQPHSPC